MRCCWGLRRPWGLAAPVQKVLLLGLHQEAPKLLQLQVMVLGPLLGPLHRELLALLLLLVPWLLLVALLLLVVLPLLLALLQPQLRPSQERHHPQSVPAPLAALQVVAGGLPLPQSHPVLRAAAASEHQACQLPLQLAP